MSEIFKNLRVDPNDVVKLVQIIIGESIIARGVRVVKDTFAPVQTAYVGNFAFAA